MSNGKYTQRAQSSLRYNESQKDTPVVRKRIAYEPAFTGKEWQKLQTVNIPPLQVLKAMIDDITLEDFIPKPNQKPDKEMKIWYYNTLFTNTAGGNFKPLWDAAEEFRRRHPSKTGSVGFQKYDNSHARCLVDGEYGANTKRRWEVWYGKQTRGANVQFRLEKNSNNYRTGIIAAVTVIETEKGYKISTQFTVKDGMQFSKRDIELLKVMVTNFLAKKW